MSLLLWKCVRLIFFLGLFQACPGEDKVEKTPSKSIDFKAKLAKTQISLPESFEPETFEKSISSLGIPVPPEDANDTVQYDHHTYYNSTFYTDPELAKRFWVEIDSYPQPVVHEMLSNSHRQATTVDLSFPFPFYGSILKNVTIATGGFLYMGDYLHNWIAATQYVAPLMANFDTNQSSTSLIKYADNGTAFTVEWDTVYIKNRMNDGAFSFQVTLLKNGDIIFAYKDIPYPISNISDASHPVKIGISDAYILERSLFFIRRKTIYEYHRIDMLKKSIGNNTALYITALPTCLHYKDCSACWSADPKLECIWCQAVKRCSDGLDRLRQSWLTNSCSVNVEKTCPPTLSTTTEHSQDVPSFAKGTILSSPSSVVEVSTKYFANSTAFSHFTYPLSNTNATSEKNLQEAAHYIQEISDVSSSMSVGAVITIVAFIATLLAAAGWVFYAYKFPQSSSGQFLIKYRPSQWSLRKEENSVSASSRHL